MKGQSGKCLENGEEEVYGASQREMQRQDHVRLIVYNKELEFYIECSGKPLVCFKLEGI